MEKSLKFIGLVLKFTGLFLGTVIATVGFLVFFVSDSKLASLFMILFGLTIIQFLWDFIEKKSGFKANIAIKAISPLLFFFLFVFSMGFAGNNEKLKEQNKRLRAENPVKKQTENKSPKNSKEKKVAIQETKAVSSSKVTKEKELKAPENPSPTPTSAPTLTPEQLKRKADEEKANKLYKTAFNFQAQGNKKAALSEYNKIKEIKPSYKDTNTRISHLEAHFAAEQKKAEEAKKAEAEAERKAEAQAEAEAKHKAEAEAQAQAKAEAARKVQAQAKAEAARKAKAQAEAEAKRKAKAQAEAEAERKAKAKAQAEANRKAAEARRKAALAKKTITATQLLKDYENNQIAADKKYNGKEVIVSGFVDTVSSGLLSGLTVTINSGSPYEINNVICYFDKKHQQWLAKLNKGQKLTLKGEVGGYILGSVAVYNCSNDVH